MLGASWIIYLKFDRAKSRLLCMGFAFRRVLCCLDLYFFFLIRI